MLKFILPAIIFLSLGIIIFILARRLPDFKKVNGNKENGKKTGSEITEERHKKKIKDFFSVFFAKIGKFFVFIAEEIVKRLKKILHLIHFWLIKLRRKETKKNKIQGEIDAKEELVEAEEKNLENVINVNLRQPEEIDLEDEQKEKEEQQKIRSIIKSESKKAEVIDSSMDNYQVENQAVLEGEKKNENKEGEELSGKVEGFFGEDDPLSIETEESMAADEKKGFFSKITDKFKRTKKEDLIEDKRGEDLNQQDFSDGIVKVDQYEKSEIKEDLLMKEVVTVRKKGSDLDEELGVDRKILERKILQKITRSPREAENYRQLGELYIKMKNYSEAQECYQQVLKIQVRDIDANKKLEKIKLLKRLGQK